MSEIIELHKDRIEALIKEMTGPAMIGNSVIIEGHRIPNMVMIDRGAMIEFVLDGRMAWDFPREWAYYAASFAATAMAIGAGHPHYTAPHKSNKSYANPCVQIEMPEGAA